MEDIAPDCPAPGSSYFRTATIDVVGRTSTYLEQVFNDILWQVQKLCSDTDALNILVENGTYTINASTITAS